VPALKPGTERLLHLLSERGGSIGVRGAFTAETLWRMGIRNTSIVGCPSLLGLRQSALERLAGATPALDKVALNLSNNVRRHALHPEAMRASENGCSSGCSARTPSISCRTSVRRWRC
jgi:hypothetical protein